MPVVRVHGVDVDWVQFPAARLMEEETNKNPEISIILPCRNEEQALPFCLQQIKETIQKNNLSAEIIVSDSSTDKSPEIVLRQAQDRPKNTDVILVKHDKEGYGRAYLEAFKIAKGKYIFMADADNTYDFSRIPDFVKELKNGFDLVIGNRLSGNIEEGAMPALNRHLGTPVLSFLLKLFFGAKIIDS
jgi:glycosyltransferase involved in cell wall biosynthesis